MWRKSSQCLSSDYVEVLMPWTKSTYCDTSACVEVNFQTSSYCAGGDCVEVAFVKASASADNGACVEVSTPGFRKSRKSADTANCVEVADCGCGTDVLVRDSKDPDGPVLSFNRAEWSAFLSGAKAGEFDL